MRIELDQEWVESVCDLCDPLFESARVGFVRQIQVRRPGTNFFVGVPKMTGVAEEVGLLWEAEPVLYSKRYPDSRIAESYGEQWADLNCIDYWVYVDAAEGLARLSIEGEPPSLDHLALTGDGRLDGMSIGAAVADILRVPTTLT